MVSQTQTQKTNLPEIDFPIMIDDDYDPVTVSITKIPVVTHQPNPDELDDGVEDVYVFVISRWAKEPIEYEKHLARLKETTKVSWAEADNARDGYDTIVIADIGYVARRGNEVLVCVHDGRSDKYILMFFEVID